MAESIVTAAPRPPAARRALEALEFPGCRSVYISRDDIADHEGCFEFRDADTETAMVCEPTSYYYERLVEAQWLDQRREGAKDFHHRLRNRVVALEAGRQHDRVRAAAPRSSGRSSCSTAA